MIRKIIELVLALLVAKPVAAATEPSKPVFNYVDFGASQTVGYGLKGFIPMEFYNDPSNLYGSVVGGSRDGYYSSGYNYWPAQCYPELVKGALQEKFGAGVDVRLQQCAINSMRAYDLDFILNEGKTADKYIQWRLGDGSPNSGWMYDLNRARNDTITIKGVDYHYQKEETNLREEFIDNVINADLITYDLGVNDFGVYLANMVVDGLYDNDLHNVIPEYADIYYKVKGVVEDLILKYYGDEISIADLQQYDFLADTFAYAFIGFITSFDNAMKKIYELNPDVEVIVVEIQNLMSGFELNFKGKMLPLGEIFGTVIDMANAYTAYFSPYAGNYYYASFEGKERVEYFLEDIRNWDGTVSSLLGMTNLIDCFNCYQEGFLLETMVKQIVFQYASNELQSNPEFASCLPSFVSVTNYDQFITVLTQLVATSAAKYQAIKERGCTIAYYTLAKAFHTVSNVNVITTDAGRAETIFNNVMGVANTGFQALASNVPMENIIAGIDQAIDALLADEADRQAFFTGMYVTYANCYFTHPNVNGHVELKEMVLKAYEEKLNKREKDATKLAEFLNGITEEDVANALVFVGAKIKDFAKQHQEEIEAVVEEVKEIFSSSTKFTKFSIQKLNEFRAFLVSAKNGLAVLLDEIGEIEEYKEEVLKIKEEVNIFLLKLDNTLILVQKALAEIDQLILTINEVYADLELTFMNARQIIADIQNRLGKSVEKIENIVSTVFEEVENVSIGAANIVGQVNKIVNRIETGFDGRRIDSVISAFKIVFWVRDLIKDVYKFSNDLSDTIKDASNGAEEIHYEFITQYDFFSSIFETGTKKIVGAVELVAKDVKPLAETLEKLVESVEVDEKVKLFFLEKANEIKEIALAKINEELEKIDRKDFIGQDVMVAVNKIKATLFDKIDKLLGVSEEEILALIDKEAAEEFMDAHDFILRVNTLFNIVDETQMSKIAKTIEDARLFIEAYCDQLLAEQNPEVPVAVIADIFDGDILFI